LEELVLGLKRKIILNFVEARECTISET